jgi:hypothetical protein
LAGEIKLAGSKTAKMRSKNGLIELDLEKGEEIVLYSGKKPKSFVVSALPMNPEKMNSWGQRTNINPIKPHP